MAGSELEHTRRGDVRIIFKVMIMHWTHADYDSIILTIPPMASTRDKVLA